jgi:hypothetical protein
MGSGVTSIRSSGTPADWTERGGWPERAVPHPSQNFVVSRFSDPHFEQRISRPRGAAGALFEDAAVLRSTAFGNPEAG